jgi:hypothetical protein
MRRVGSRCCGCCWRARAGARVEAEVGVGLLLGMMETAVDETGGAGVGRRETC